MGGMRVVWDLKISSTLPLHDRLEISAGTRVATTQEVDECEYEPGARIPVEQWRGLTRSEELKIVARASSNALGSTIWIVKLPFQLTEKVRRALTYEIAMPVQQALSKVISEAFFSATTPIWIGPTYNGSNLLTVTKDHRLNRFIGLHVDSWDREPVDERKSSRNRISFNFGRERRYFLFLPFTLQKILTVLRQLDRTIDRRSEPSEIGRIFLTLFPHTPVVRCSLEPGEGYIAPTENIVHDGSSLGTSSMDHQFTLRGHFSPR